MRIVLSGGGTGGHLMPVLALSQALRSQAKQSEIFFIGTGDETERALVEAAGLKYYAVPSGKFRRYGRGLLNELTDFKTIRANFRDVGNILKGRQRALVLLKKIQPDVVFTKGSQPSIPVGFAATKLGIPLVIHESDTIMGLANKILAKKATAIATGLPIKSFTNVSTQARIVHTGNPVRDDITRGTAAAANKFFGLNPKRPLVLVIGGSNGAHPVNTALWEALPELLPAVQVIHQTGKNDADQAESIKGYLEPAEQAAYHPLAFIGPELADAYARADIVISRCGANSLAELAILRKPSILVPWPGAAHDHQLANAVFFHRRGAARVIEQSDLSAKMLTRSVLKLMKHHDEQHKLSEAIGRLAEREAAQKLAKLVLKTGEQHG